MSYFPVYEHPVQEEYPPHTMQASSSGYFDPSTHYEDPPHAGSGVFQPSVLGPPGPPRPPRPPYLGPPSMASLPLASPAEIDTPRLAPSGIPPSPPDNMPPHLQHGNDERMYQAQLQQDQLMLAIQQQNGGPLVGRPALSLHMDVRQRATPAAGEQIHCLPKDVVDRFCDIYSEYDPELGKQAKRFKCLIADCERVFPRKSAISSHIQTHLDDRPFKCPAENCTKSFVRHHDFNRHMEMHIPKRKHSCNCGKDFARADALARHRRRELFPSCAIDVEQNDLPFPAAGEQAPHSGGPERAVRSQPARHRSGPYTSR